jgi:Fe2+ or Zn2+ uptake regulation protein
MHSGYNNGNQRHQTLTNSGIMATVCKHPRVRIVSRHEDSEFVECLECGEVFDSEEFHDMEIEDTVETEEAESDS